MPWKIDQRVYFVRYFPLGFGLRLRDNPGSKSKMETTHHELRLYQNYTKTLHHYTTLTSNSANNKEFTRVKFANINRAPIKEPIAMGVVLCTCGEQQV